MIIMVDIDRMAEMNYASRDPQFEEERVSEEEQVQAEIIVDDARTYMDEAFDKLEQASSALDDALEINPYMDIEELKKELEEIMNRLEELLNA